MTMSCRGPTQACPGARSSMTARDYGTAIGGWAAAGAACGAATGTAHGAMAVWLAIGAAVGAILGGWSVVRGR